MMPSGLRFSVLSAADVERIHGLSLKVLEETGIALHYPPARALFQRHGGFVDEGSQRVRIPRRLVEEALKSAPRQVTVFGQDDSERDCLLELDGRRHARTCSGLNWIVDYGDARRRPVTEQDVVNWTRVIQTLPNIHLAGSLFDQEDAVKSAEVRCLARMLPHTDKPFMFSAFSGEVFCKQVFDNLI